MVDPAWAEVNLVVETVLILVVATTRVLLAEGIARTLVAVKPEARIVLTSVEVATTPAWLAAAIARILAEANLVMGTVRILVAVGAIQVLLEVACLVVETVRTSAAAGILVFQAEEIVPRLVAGNRELAIARIFPVTLFLVAIGPVSVAAVNPADLASAIVQIFLVIIALVPVAAVNNGDPVTVIVRTFQATIDLAMEMEMATIQTLVAETAPISATTMAIISTT